MNLIAVDPEFLEELKKDFGKLVEQFESCVYRLSLAEEKARAGEMLTPEEAAKYLGVTVPMMDYYERHGLNCYRTCHRGKWFRRGDIDEWIKAGRVNRH